jgi:two-component system cell cycle sensor histidine kinase/response regulator CckA
MMYTGRSEPRFSAVDLPSLVQESIGLLSVSLNQNCELLCEFPQGDLLVWGDPAQLQQIILNLANNSAEAKATRILFKARIIRGPSGSCNPFEALSSGEYLELSVADDGEGMTPEVRARIFEPFYSTKFAGRGLGLPAVMGLLRAHRGTIAVESTPGSGTTIKVYIPVAPGAVAAADEPASIALPLKPGTVLIADDEDMVRRVVVQYLKRRGWQTLVAVDGAEAVRMHAEHPGQIDLLILDHLMPNRSGLEAAGLIRSRDPHIPVVLMSGFTNQETVEKFRSQGFGHFLKKPFQLQELLAIMQQASN